MAEEPNVFVDLTEGRELVINRIVTTSFVGSQHVITLGANRFGIDAEGNLQPQTAIVARLRFDTDMLKMLVDNLAQAFQVVTPPPNEKAN